MSDEAKNAKDDLMYGLLQQAVQKMDGVRDDVSKLDKKLDLHIQKTEFELSRINELDETQNQLLDQHIQGVNTLKRWCDDHEKMNNARFVRLEEPRKWLKTTKNGILWISAVAGALTVIAKFIGMF